MDDNIIIDQLFERQDSVLEQLQQKYGALCHNVAYSILDSEEDSKECMNDVLIPIYGYTSNNLLVKSFTAHTENGKYTFDEILDKKANTAGESRYYSVTASVMGASGRTPYTNIIYLRNYEQDMPHRIGILGGFTDYRHSSFDQTYAYRSYRYRLSYSYSLVYDDTNFMKVSESYEGDPVLTALLI